MADSPGDPLIRGVPDTAFMVAAWRAAESERPDALFRDPFAARLCGERGRAMAASLPSGALGRWQVTIRTVIIDDFIQRAVAAGTDTVVNLGAGLDARPYRMALPASLRFIEVDYPEIIDWKTARLAEAAPRCRLERVKLDLADLPARRALLAGLGGAPGKVLFLTEGVIPYLTAEAVGALADDLRAVAGARWILDYFSPQTLRYRRRVAESRHMRQAPFRFETDDWFGFFAGHGWTPLEARYLGEEGRRLRRPVPFPPLVRLLVKLRRLFGRRPAGGLQRFAGYVLLGPADGRAPGA